MPQEKPPALSSIDWPEFVERMRLNELSQRFNRPSDMLRRHSAQWLEEWKPRRRWLGGPWATEQELRERAAARANLMERMELVLRTHNAGSSDFDAIEEQRPHNEGVDR